MISYQDRQKILYDRNASILRFKNMSKFFRGTTLEDRFRKTKKMRHDTKIEKSALQVVKAR